MTQRPPFFSTALSVLIPLCCGALGFALFPLFARGPVSGDASSGGNRAASCIVLAADESFRDTEIRQVLAGLGLGDFISESSQEIPVDDFGELKMIPLVSFRDEVETFDPRDNGYAEQLRAFFVRDEKRFFFLPLASPLGMGRLTLKKRLSSLLGDIPFSFAVLENSPPFGFRFAIFAVSCATAFSLSRSKRLFLRGLPVLLPLGFCGGSAFVFAALLCGIRELLREPFGELSAAYSGDRWNYDYAGGGFGGLRERFRPFRLNGVSAAVLAAFFFALSALGETPFFPLAASFFLFFFLFFLDFMAGIKKARGSPHRPFTPVLLFPLRAKTFAFFPSLLPFAAAALLAVFEPLFFSGFLGFTENEISGELHRARILPEDYYRHIAFQRSFSYRRLGKDAPESGEDYLRYRLGEDGLISGGERYSGKERDMPSFPLEKLMGFLIQYYRDNKNGNAEASHISPQRTAGAEKFKERIPAAVIFLFCILDMLPVIRYRKKSTVFGDKRIAA